MKQADVKIGSTYDTVIGAERCRVVVVSEIPGDNSRWRATKTRYRVRRENEVACLPKLRSAAALREV